MEIKLRYELYNADGSSFTPTRCEQICDVFDMTTKYGDSIISYRQLQELAFENNVFGAIGFDHTASAIRTIFPILKKLGLIVDYEMIKEFKSVDFFSAKGKAFVLTHRALMKAQGLGNEPLIKECEDAKSAILRDGIKTMYEKGSYSDHNIWLALTFFKYQGGIIWKEFLYMVYLNDMGLSITDIDTKLQENRKQGIEYNYKSTDGREIRSTAYSYLKALLNEADVIQDTHKGISKTTYKGYDLLNQLKL